MLVPYDDQVTGVDLANSQDEIQVAQGAPVTDGDGTRKATLLLEPGTDAKATLPDGTTKDLGDRLNIRATEFTIGASGPAAMPGELPPTSAYTYAVEYSVDEASKQEAVDVQFTKPVVTYVDNYLKFPAGTVVPMGYYDREQAQWVPAPNGVTIAIVGESGGRALLDVTGDGAADTGAKLTALGIDDDELAKLADLYNPGTSLWRAAITHFTPWDYNWPYGLPDGAGGPDQGGPDGGDPPGDDPCGQGGSLILCEDQVLGEQAAIAGTPFALVYQSDRVPGRRTGDSLEIPLTGANPPASLGRVDLTIEVAGRTITRTYPRTPNLNYTYIFDGLDAYGRPVVGRQNVDVKIDYVYSAIYRAPGSFSSSFAAVGGQTISGNRTRQEISVSQEWSGTVGGLTAPPSALAGWSVDVHHTYDPVGRTLYLGDGSKRSADGQNFDVITTTKSGLAFPEGLAAGPDGSLVVADSTADVVRRIAPNGTTTIVAGTGVAGFAGDGGAATAARLNHPADVALAVDGSILIADEGNNRIRRVSPDGVISSIAGAGGSGYDGDGGPATAALLDEPSDVAIDESGAVYIVDRANHALRRIGTDGVIATLAGNGSPGFAGDGGVATRARLRFPRDVAVRGDGSVFVADAGNNRVRRIDADGTIETVAGNGGDTYAGDGGLAVDAGLDTPSAVLPLRDGGVLIADGGHAVLRKLASDGTIATVAGNGTPGFRGDGGPSAKARIDFPQAIALGTDETVFVADAGNDRIRSLGTAMPGLQLGEFTIASEDGRSLFVFDRSGRHLKTLDSLTGTEQLRFVYDARGRLTGIIDGDNQATTIQRNATTGAPTAIVGPYGQQTALEVSAGGFLSRIANPANERILLEYSATGLLTKYTDSRNGVHTFDYDTLGRLTKDTDADGSSQTLTRSVAGGATTVTHTTGENRATTFRVQRNPDGSIKRSVTDGVGRATVTEIGNDGVTTVTHADGTKMTQEVGPDPRFGMQSPVTTRITITTPSGVRSVVERERLAELDAPGNALSLRSLTETTTSNGKTVTSRYESAGRRFIDSSPTGRTQLTEIDLRGRPVRKVTPGISPTTFSYDARGRLIGTTAGSRTEGYAYDSLGRMATVTDALSRTTELSYDLADRLAAVKRPDGRQVAYTYDAAGNRVTVTPPGRAPHSFAFNARNGVDRLTPPLLGSLSTQTTYSADRDELVTGVHRPDGTTVGYEYDLAGRVRRMTQPAGATEFTYSAQTGHLASATAPGGQKIDYAYDGSLPTKFTFSGGIAGEISASYDADLRVASETVAGTPAITYAFDDDSMLTRAGALNLTRGADDGLIGTMAIGNSNTTVTRTGLGELSTVVSRQGSSTAVYSLGYGRDAAGRITSKTETRGTSPATQYVYTYDGSDRLHTVTRNGALSATYNYDDNGNRKQVDRPGDLPLTADYDEQDRLTRYGANTYTYTAAGELLTKTSPEGLTQYVYDAVGSLSKVTLPSGVVVEYVLDAGGRRVGVKRNGSPVQGFLYGRTLGPAAELNADGTVKSRFIYATRSNVPDYMVQGGVTYRILTDQVGSPRIVTNASTGAVVYEMDYDEYGRVTRETGTVPIPFGFAGGLYDRDTKLVRFGARDYDAETGRFTAKDPLSFEGGDTNLYGYALGDPVNVTDSTGMILDTLLDIGFIAYDLYNIGKSLANGCGVSGTDLLALGADVAGALIPFATGGGAAVRAGRAAMNAADAGRGGAAAVRTGQAGEAAVRAANNIGPLTKTPISINGRTRIPDGLTPGTLSEVKNVASQSYTQQLRDFAAYAQQTGRSFDLYVRPNTRLSGPLQDAIANGTINLKFIP